MSEFSRVSRKAKAKWRVTRLIGLILLAVILLPFAIGNGLWGYIVCGFIAFLQLINLIVYPIIEYIQWSYLITDDRIEIKKGIFWRSHTVIPISRIQHVAAKSGPIQRMFGLASVEIHTAGGVHAIQELDKAVADDICAKLQNVVNKKVAAQLGSAAQQPEAVEASAASDGGEVK